MYEVFDKIEHFNIKPHPQPPYLPPASLRYKITRFDIKASRT